MWQEEPEITSDALLAQAAEFSRIGFNYLKKQDWHNAEEQLKKAVKSYETLDAATQEDKLIAIANAYHNLGIVYVNLSKYNLAKDHIQKALNIRLERYQDSETTVKRYADQETSTAKQAAININTAAYKNVVTSINAFAQLSRAFLQISKWDEAETSFRAVIKYYDILPINDACLTEKANAYLNLGLLHIRDNIPAAKRHLEKALNIGIDLYKNAKEDEAKKRTAKESIHSILMAFIQLHKYLAKNTSSEHQTEKRKIQYYQYVVDRLEEIAPENLGRICEDIEEGVVAIFMKPSADLPQPGSHTKRLTTKNKSFIVV